MCILNSATNPDYISYSQIIPKLTLDTAVASEDRDALAELAERFDSHFSCPLSFDTVDSALGPLLKAERKMPCVRVRNATFKDLFGVSAFWPNESNDGYIIAVSAFLNNFLCH
jgi:hypothetical protein